MKTIEAVFKIVTPLFMSGADQDLAELRPPSIKGIIRFWWRALAYSRFNGDLHLLAEREAELFGSTDRVASIMIRVSTHPKSTVTQKNTVHHDFRSVAGARYLGYGLMDAFDGVNTQAGKLQRPCINQNQQFTVTFMSKNDMPEEFINAVKLTGLLGGLGSRSRKGYGSLTLLKLSNELDWVTPNSKKTYKFALDNLLNGISTITEEPSFSAFSQLTRIDYLLQSNDPIQLLNLFGLQMQRYRSWGHHGNVNGENSEQNFESDHHWYKHLDNYREDDFHPRRIIFGLPHNYSRYEIDNVSGAEYDRRASPLLIHIHEYAPKSYCLISVVLRAEFLPDSEKIQAGTNQVTQDIEWEIIDQFLDGYIGHRDRKTKTRYFPRKQEDTWLGG